MFNRSRPRTLGFTLIELAIVLGITGLLFTGLWRLLSNGNQQLRDQATASQQQQLITAVNIYLASSYGQTWMAGQGMARGGTKSFPLPLPPATYVGNSSVAGTTACKTWYDNTQSTSLDSLCTILPPGFSQTTVNPYGQAYYNGANSGIRILNDGTAQGTPPQAYSFMIVTSGGDTISDTDGGRISSMIGGDGGFLYNSNVCGAPTNQLACGAYGAWLQNITGYGFPAPAAAASAGFVASRTYYSPNQSSTSPWLARVPMPGDTANYTYNTMAWDMFVGKSTTGFPFSVNLTSLIPTGTGGNINMGGIASGAPGSGTEVPAATGGGAINMANGSINMLNGITTTGATTAAINMNGGTINMAANGAATGGGDINLQGGLISGAGANNMISINGTGTTTSPVSLTNSGCVIKQFAPVTGQAEDASGNPCDYAVYVDSLTASNLINANALYANTFIYQSSDFRLKTNIYPIKNSLDAIMELNPVDFTFKSSGKEGLGIIAQDVEKIYPQLVVTGPSGMKAVNYDGLIAPLIGAVQELKKENDRLRQEIVIQKLREEKIEKELNQH